MSLPVEENMINIADSKEQSGVSIDTDLHIAKTKPKDTGSGTFPPTLLTQEIFDPLEINGRSDDVPNNVDDGSELLVQTILDEDRLLYENDSYVEIGRRLISAKNSLELIAIQGNPRKNTGWESGNIALDLQRINDENQASTDASKSVILNNANANVKANGHHVAWVDSETVNGLTTEDIISDVVTERAEMTISNHSMMDTPAENPFNNPQNDNLSALSSDDEIFTNDKVDDSKLLSVEGQPIPDPEYVSKRVDPMYYSLIKRNYKKDCRSWLYKNKAAKRRVHFVCEEAANKMNAKR